MSAFNDGVIAVAAIFAALIVICGGLLKLYNIAKRIDGAIGVDEKGRTISQRLTSVENAVLPDGRTSLPARVDQIETEVKELATEVRVIKDVILETGTKPKHAG